MYSLTIGDCDCKAIPSNWPSVRVIVAQKGQSVDLYSGSNCDGKYMSGFPNRGTFSFADGSRLDRIVRKLLVEGWGLSD
jgi:hypothetical protein